jgi:hypothetical protein
MPGSKDLFFYSLLVLLAGLVVYALTTRTGSNPPAAAPADSNSPALVAQTSSVPALPPPVSPPAAPVDGPRIQFASLVHDFGRANGDDLVHCVFFFTNTGNSLLEVSDVSPGCGCMKAGEWSRKVEPGKTGSIPVQYDSHHYTGPFAKSVFVTCNDPSQPKPMLEIKGTVWRPIEIRPETAVLNLNADAPSNATAVHIISHLDEPLTVTDLKWTNTAFAVELLTNQPGKEYQLLVRTTPPWPSSRQMGQITLSTSATNRPVIRINAFANVLPIIMAIPFQIGLPPPPLTNPFPYTVWIRNNGTNPLTVSEPSVNAAGVDVQVKEEQPGQQFGVTATFPAGFEVAPGQRIELSVKSNHPQFPVVKVPVIQLPRPSPVAAPGPGQPVPSPRAGGQ